MDRYKDYIFLPIKMSESKEAVFKQWEEAKTHVNLIDKETNACDDARWNCLCRLEEAYKKNDTVLINDLEKELKTHFEIFQDNRARRKDADQHVFQPALLKVSRYIDEQCGYPPRETL